MNNCLNSDLGESSGYVCDPSVKMVGREDVKHLSTTPLSQSTMAKHDSACTTHQKVVKRPSCVKSSAQKAMNEIVQTTKCGNEQSHHGR